MIADRFTVESSKLLQKKSAENRIIYKILTSQNTLLEDANLILKEAQLSYEKIFKAQKVDETSQGELLREPPYSLYNENPYQQIFLF